MLIEDSALIWCLRVVGVVHATYLRDDTSMVHTSIFKLNTVLSVLTRDCHSLTEKMLK